MKKSINKNIIVVITCIIITLLEMSFMNFVPRFGWVIKSYKNKYVLKEVKDLNINQIRYTYLNKDNNTLLIIIEKNKINKDYKIILSDNSVIEVINNSKIKTNNKIFEWYEIFYEFNLDKGKLVNNIITVGNDLNLRIYGIIIFPINFLALKLLLLSEDVIKNKYKMFFLTTKPKTSLILLYKVTALIILLGVFFKSIRIY